MHTRPPVQDSIFFQTSIEFSSILLKLSVFKEIYARAHKMTLLGHYHTEHPPKIRMKMLDFILPIDFTYERLKWFLILIPFSHSSNAGISFSTPSSNHLSKFYFNKLVNCSGLIKENNNNIRGGFWSRALFWTCHSDVAFQGNYLTSLSKQHIHAFFNDLLIVMM